MQVHGALVQLNAGDGWRKGGLSTLITDALLDCAFSNTPEGRASTRRDCLSHVSHKHSHQALIITSSKR